jgi:hypothetical protein
VLPLDPLAGPGVEDRTGADQLGTYRQLVERVGQGVDLVAELAGVSEDGYDATGGGHYSSSG